VDDMIIDTTSLLMPSFIDLMLKRSL